MSVHQWGGWVLSCFPHPLHQITRFSLSYISFSAAIPKRRNFVRRSTYVNERKEIHRGVDSYDIIPTEERFQGDLIINCGQILYSDRGSQSSLSKTNFLTAISSIRFAHNGAIISWRIDLFHKVFSSSAPIHKSLRLSDNYDNNRKRE